MDTFRIWLEDEEKINKKRLMTILKISDMDEFTPIKDFNEKARNEMAENLDGYADSLKNIGVSIDKIEQAKMLLANPEHHTLDTLLKTLLSPVNLTPTQPIV